MCGRYALHAESEELIAAYAVQSDAATPRLEPRYNVAPTQEVPIVVAEGEARRLRLVRWGLVPAAWPAPNQRGAPLINARAESLAARAVFRRPFERSRCLVPASGFYEWQRAGGARQPYYFTPAADEPLAFAGLHDRWQRGAAPPLPSCTIITVPAAAPVAALHDRMPALLSPAEWETWLDAAAPPETLRALLRPSAATLLSYPVTPRVNHYAYDRADAVTPLAPPPQPH